MNRFRILAIFGISALIGHGSIAQDLESKPADPFFEKFTPIRAPVYTNLLLRTGDRLAIIGDSITQQKQYSCNIETYLTVCVPELKVSVRQFGWNGETAAGFLLRMTNDCLRFKPTIATLCYGMNDHAYGPYDEKRAQWYRQSYTTVARVLKDAGARVVLGSPGCVGRVPAWSAYTNVPVEELNLNLCQLRNIDIDIAAQEKIRFADVFWPMFTVGHSAQKKFGPDFAIAGKDGVHPDAAGHLVMTYAFLKALGLDGNIGTFTVDLAANTARVSNGHTLNAFTNGTLTITSTRYPFCASGPTDKDDSTRAGMNLVPFNDELNRLVLVVKNGKADKYAVTWGGEKRIYSNAQLAAGVNLAEDFEVNPFTDAFDKVDNAVFLKQTYETTQIKEMFHTPAAQADPDGVAETTEKGREPFVDAIVRQFVPVTHTIKIEAL